MTDTTAPSAEGDAEAYSRARHHDKYGLQQHHPGLSQWISITWRGSARELIREQALDAWRDLDPRGCVVPAFERHETTVKIQSFPEAKALYGLITDELYRRQINQRQRNSLHTAREQLVEAFEERQREIESMARSYWNGHQFRSEGEIPSPSIAVDDVRLDAPVTDDDFVGARVRRHLGPQPSTVDVERVVSELPLMYGLDDEIDTV